MSHYPKYNDIIGRGSYPSSDRRVAPAPIERDVSETDIDLDDEISQPVLVDSHGHFLQLMGDIDTTIPNTEERRRRFNNAREIFNRLSNHESFNTNPLMNDINTHLDNRYNSPHRSIPHYHQMFIGRVLRSGLPYDERPPLE